jgi:hypothetical protein
MTYYEDDGPLATMADAAREYHNQGLQCPFDCWRCQPAEPNEVGAWLVTFADGCHTDEPRYEDGAPVPPTGGYCAHGWQPVVAAVEFLGLPYVRIPDPPPYDPWTETCPF